jgi:hypothetical protein
MEGEMQGGGEDRRGGGIHVMVPFNRQRAAMEDPRNGALPSTKSEARLRMVRGRPCRIPRMTPSIDGEWGHYAHVGTRIPEMAPFTSSSPVRPTAASVVPVYIRVLWVE